jgi:hypothetical protein
VMGLLAEHNFPVQMRMVDGELTMPDEVLPGGWKEVRLGTPLGMVTLVRRGQEPLVVTWGNANDRCSAHGTRWPGPWPRRETVRSFDRKGHRVQMMFAHRLLCLTR